MKRLTHYVTIQYITITFFVTLSVTVTAWLSQLLKFFQIVISRAKHIVLILKPALLMLPDLTAFVLPITLFIGILFALNRMLNDRELLIMKASGVSEFQIAKPILACVFGAMVILYAAGYSFLPNTFKSLKTIENDLRSSHSGIVLHEGSFNPLPGGITVYVREKGEEEGFLHGIFVHLAKPGEPLSILTAESGQVVNTEHGPRIVLNKGTRQEKSHKDGKISIMYFDQAIRELLPPKGDGKGRTIKAHELTTPELFAIDREPGTRFHDMVTSELHQRFISPLYCLVYALIALVILLKGSFNRRGSPRRLLISVILVVIIQGVVFGLKSLSVTNAFFLTLNYAFPFSCIGLGFYFLHQQDGRFSVWMDRIGL